MIITIPLASVLFASSAPVWLTHLHRSAGTRGRTLARLHTASRPSDHGMPEPQCLPLSPASYILCTGCPERTSLQHRHRHSSVTTVNHLNRFIFVCVVKKLFSYLQYLPTVLWHCWLGVRKSIRPVKIEYMRCWCGYLSVARCRLFANGPADATAVPKPHHLLPHLNPYFSFSEQPG